MESKDAAEEPNPKSAGELLPLVTEADNVESPDVLSQLPNWSDSESDDPQDPELDTDLADTCSMSSVLTASTSALTTASKNVDVENLSALAGSASDVGGHQGDHKLRVDSKAGKRTGVVSRSARQESRADSSRLPVNPAKDKTISVSGKDGRKVHLMTSGDIPSDSSSLTSDSQASGVRKKRSHSRQVVKLSRRHHVKHGESFSDPMRQASTTEVADIKTTFEAGVALNSLNIRSTYIWQTYMDEATKAIKNSKYEYTLRLVGLCRRLELPIEAINRCAVYEATCYTELGRYKEAIDRANEVLAENPNNIHARMVLSAALYKNGELEMALVSYYRALFICPNNRRIRSRLERCQRHLQRVFQTVAVTFSLSPVGQYGKKEQTTLITAQHSESTTNEDQEA